MSLDPDPPERRDAIRFAAPPQTCRDGPEPLLVEDPQGRSRGERLGALVGNVIEPAHLTAHHRTRPGQLIPDRTRRAPISNEHGRIAAIVTGVKDLRAALRRSRRRAAAIRAGLRAEARERRRLASELHDSLAQILALARLRLASLRDAMGPSHTRERAPRLEDLLADADRQIRAELFRLDPGDVGDSGLVHALGTLAEELHRGYRLRVRIEPGPEPDRFGRLRRDVAVILFRGLRELLINVARHGGTSEALVRATTAVESDAVVVEVRDHGRGFDPDQDLEYGFGLFSLRERIDAIGGTLRVESAPGAGTTVRIELPRASTGFPEQPASASR